MAIKMKAGKKEVVLKMDVPPSEKICKEVHDNVVMVMAAKPLPKDTTDYLKVLCEQYGIDYSNRTSVGAKTDMELLEEIKLAMCKEAGISVKKRNNAITR